MNCRITSITLEPGDATRYDIDVVCMGARTFLVTLYKDRTRTSGLTMKFRVPDLPFGAYHPEQVATRMGCTVVEAGVVLAYLRSEYHINAVLEAGFNQDTGVWVGNTVH